MDRRDFVVRVTRLIECVLFGTYGLGNDGQAEGLGNLRGPS
jgi:hypothetical protein